MQTTVSNYALNEHTQAWAMAQSKIEAAERDDEDVLNLQGTMVSRLIRVPTLGLLPALRSLNLSHNNLRVFPDAVFALCGLRSLNLEGNQLSSVPNDIVRMTRLADLDLSHNAFVLAGDACAPFTDAIPSLFGMPWFCRLVLQHNRIGAGWQQRLVDMGAKSQVSVLVAGCSEPDCAVV